MTPLRTVGPILLVLALPITALAQAPARFTVEVEAGPVAQTVNDVRIPNTTSATRFSLLDIVGKGPWPAGRAYLTWNYDERHALRLLAAPLTVTGTGTPAEALRFAGVDYQAGLPVGGTYRFDSYRLTWRARIRHGARWTLWVGATAKVRSANIELHQGAATSRKTDLGFVPLLHVAGDGRLGSRLHLLLDMDALAGGPGRAEDVAVKVGYDLGRRWRLAGGYRTVEGGADVKSVYTFAWLHYGVMSVAYTF